MASHREPKWCCVSSLTKIVTFFAVPFWSIPTPPAVARPGQHRPGRDRYVPKHNARNDGEHPGPEARSPGSGQLPGSRLRSEEHTSELQSLRHLVCRLL